MFVVSIRQVSVRFNFKVVKGWGLYPFRFHVLLSHRELTRRCFFLLHRALTYTYWLSDYGKEYRERALGRLFQPLKYLVLYRTQKKFKNMLWSHGMGRHTEQEIFEIAEKDLVAVSEILGPKKFLFGDKPCLADASLFAFIVGSAWEHPKSPFVEFIKSKAQNLQEHALRMKETYYPDWDEMRAEKAKSCLPYLISGFSGAVHN